jgi:uncharacterized protein
VYTGTVPGIENSIFAKTLPMATGFCMLVQDVELTEDFFDPPKSQILAGSPRVFYKILNEQGNIVRGVWKCTVGTVTDIEEDEMFTIIEGKGSVSIEGGPTLQLSPGTVGFFQKGAKTTWVIEEDILKTYQITMP